MTSANLMTIEDAAEVLHVSVGALRARIRRGTGPKPFRLGDSQRLFWREQDLRAWIDQQAREQGAAYADVMTDPGNVIEPPARRRPGRPRKN
jgi:predicted DNA-binding transcriptional regulator AlpA